METFYLLQTFDGSGWIDCITSSVFCEKVVKNKGEKTMIIMEGRDCGRAIFENGETPTLKQIENEVGYEVQEPDWDGEPENDGKDFEKDRENQREFGGYSYAIFELHKKTGWPLSKIERIKAGKHPGGPVDWLKCIGGQEFIAKAEKK